MIKLICLVLIVLVSGLFAPCGEGQQPLATLARPAVMSELDNIDLPDGEWDFYGINISGMESIDLYKMDIDISARNRGSRTECYLTDLSNAPSNTSYGNDVLYRFGAQMGYGSSVKLEVGVIITFVDLQYISKADGVARPIYIRINADVVIKREFNGYWLSSLADNATITLSLSNGYYKWIQTQPAVAVNKIKVSLISNDVVTRCEYQTDNWWDRRQAYNISLTTAPSLYAVPTDPDVMDPSNPDFDPDNDNTGSNQDTDPTQVPDVSLDIEWLKDLIAELSAWLSAVGDFFAQWGTIIVIVVGLLLLAPLWGPLVSMLFGTIGSGLLYVLTLPLEVFKRRK